MSSLPLPSLLAALYHPYYSRSTFATHVSLLLTISISLLNHFTRSSQSLPFVPFNSPPLAPLELPSLAPLVLAADKQLFPGLIYRMMKPKVVLLIFVSGKIVLTGAKVREEIYMAFNQIYSVLVGTSSFFLPSLLPPFPPSPFLSFLDYVLISHTIT